MSPFAPSRRSAWAQGLLAGEKGILEMIALGRPLPEVLEALVHAIEEQAAGLICSLLVLDEDGARLRHGAAPSLPAGIRESIDGIGIAPPTTPCTAAAHTGEPAIVPDLVADPLWSDHGDLALQYGLHACWAVPIKSRAGAVLGTLALYCGRQRSPSSSELALLDRAQHLAGVAIERDRTEAELLQAGLRESEDMFRDMFESSPDAIVAVNRDGRIVCSNRQVEALFGYAGEDLIGAPIETLVPERFVAAHVAHRGRYAAVPTVRTMGSGLDLYGRRKDGSEFSADIMLVPVETATGRMILCTVRDISERKRAEAEIKKNEERFHNTFDLIPIGINHVDLEGRILLANARMAQIVGYTPGELIGYNIKDFSFPEDDEVTKELWTLREKLWAGEIQSISRERRYRHRNGSPILVAITIAVQRDAEGRPLYDITAIEDITARKRAEQLQMLEHSVNRSLADTDNVAAAMQAAIRAICETEGWECGRYFRCDEVAGTLRFGHAWGVVDPVVQRFIADSRSVTYSRGEGLVGRVWETGQPIWAADLSGDTRVGKRALAKELGIRGAFVFPVISEGKTIGVLAFSSRATRESDQRLIEAIRVIGSQIGQFLRRKQGEEELRRFRLAMDNSADMIVLIDRATMRFVDVNAAACRLLGYSREEMLQMGPQDVLPLSREALEQEYDALSAKPSASTGVLSSGMKNFYRCKDGSSLPFESTRRVLRSGDAYIVAAISRDIRERIASETALTESNERFNLAARATNDGIWDWNIATGELWWNENFAQVLGYHGENAAPSHQSWKEGIHPDDRDRVEAGIRRAIDSGNLDWSEEYRLRRGDGSYAHVFDRGQIVRDGAGRALRMIGAMADITERKQTEQKILDQALRQRLIAEFGQQVLASTDLDDVLIRSVELVSKTLKADYCNLLELDHEGKNLVFRAAAGWPKEWIGRRAVPVRPGTRAELVLSRREPLVIEDYDQEADYSSSPCLVEFGVRSGIVAPLFGTQGTFGMLSAHSLQPRRFKGDDLSFLQSVANILAVAIKRRSAEERLAYLAQFDALTGLPNRYLFQDRLTQSMVQAKRSGHPMGVLFIDLDRFKLVNDTLGHSAGDKLLKEAAARLTQCVRSGDTVGRFSGDEFGAILSDLAKPGDASIVAQKVIDALARPFRLDGHETYVSGSVGIALFPADGEEADALIGNADVAMYRAKEQGRSTYQYFTSEMNERAVQRMELEAALRQAMERNAFQLRYQPKVDLESGAICGLEALLRWWHPDRGMVPPGEFIPVLEDAGLIVPVGEWVVREVCGQIQAWGREGLPALPVAVNLSARQFLQKDLESTVRRILHDTGTDPSLVQFEITESLLMREPEEAARTLRGLKELGMKISVDDFGTGYSSLAYLKRFPIDSLKIDRAFIRDVTTNPDDAAITRAIIGLAHSLKLKVVAEGVETEGQLNFLSTHACDEMQGYYFAKPVTTAELEAMLREGRRLKRSGGGAPSEPWALLLDDSEQELLPLEEILRSDGFAVLKTTDPRHAFELLAGHPVSIVISDQNMPRMTGVEFLDHVRKLYPTVLRILTSGADEPSAIADAINQAGIHGFLSKDWDRARLRAELLEVYRRHHPKRGAISPQSALPIG